MRQSQVPRQIIQDFNESPKGGFLFWKGANMEIWMDEEEYCTSDKTDDELRELLLIHPKQKDFYLRPRDDDT